MAVGEEVRLVELVAGRMCHDLVGAVGAVANGVELLGDGRSAPDAEVMALIGDSARRANRRLQYFRMAYGTATGISGAGRLAEARKVAAALFEGESRVTFAWPALDSQTDSVAGRSAAKIVLLLVLAAIEALPRGGKITVGARADDGRIRLAATAAGANARLPDEMAAALSDAVDLAVATPKAVPAVLARRIAVAVSGNVGWRPVEGDGVELTAEIPSGA